MNVLFDNSHATGITKITSSDSLGRGEYLEYLVTVECNAAVNDLDVLRKVADGVQKLFREKYGPSRERVTAMRVPAQRNADFPYDSMWRVQIRPWAVEA